MFVMPIPKSKRKSEYFPRKRPDLDKLIRAIDDGVTGVWLKDDSVVVEIHAYKVYGEETGAWIILSEKKP